MTTKKEKPAEKPEVAAEQASQEQVEVIGADLGADEQAAKATIDADGVITDIEQQQPAQGSATTADAVQQTEPDAAASANTQAQQQDQLNETEQQQQSEPVIARVLVDLRIAGEVYHPNQLIQADSTLIDQLEDAGEVSSDDAAVDYCRSIGAEVIVIETK